MIQMVAGLASDTALTMVSVIGGGGSIGLLLTRAFTGTQKQWLEIHRAQADDLRALRVDLSAARDETLTVKKLAIDEIAHMKIEAAEQLAALRLDLTQGLAAERLHSAQGIAAATLAEQECRHQVDEMLASIHTMQLENAGLRQLLVPPTPVTIPVPVHIANPTPVDVHEVSPPVSGTAHP